MQKFGFLLAVILLLALVPDVPAGFWAVIVIDDVPGEIHAGEPWTVGFTVLQHGQTPVHKLFDGYDFTPIEPILIATHTVTGEQIQATATATKEAGHFTLEVTFPGEGRWSWTIKPEPLGGETQFESLTVLPAVVAVDRKAQAESAIESPLVNRGLSISSALRWGALVVALMAVALFAAQSLRRGQTANVESGR